jgi:glycosyltransferase involved in cell wall biosynthesis
MNKSPFFFSIIIPTYNRSSLLLNAINSVLSQTYPFFELIIADDCSTDNTELVVKSINDSRIKYYKLSKNGGNAVARNAGVRLANYEFICFLDSDDAYKNNFLEDVHQFCSSLNHHTGFFWTGIDIVDENNHTISSGCWIPDARTNGPNQFFYNLKTGTNCGLVVKRKYFDQIGGFDESLRAAVDTDFLLRLRKITNCECLNKSLVIYHHHSNTDSVRKNYNNQSFAYTVILKKHKDVWLNNRKLKNKWFYKALWLNYYAINKKSARRIYLQNWMHLKSFLILLLFELFPAKTAIEMHKKIASKGFV